MAVNITERVIRIVAISPGIRNFVVLRSGLYQKTGCKSIGLYILIPESARTSFWYLVERLLVAAFT